MLTNSSFGALSLWLVWKKNEVKLLSILGLFMTGGFLMAYALQDLYSGSMKYLDGSEKTVLGINIGVLGFGIVFLLFLSTLYRSFRKEDQVLQ